MGLAKKVILTAFTRKNVVFDSRRRFMNPKIRDQNQQI